MIWTRIRCGFVGLAESYRVDTWVWYTIEASVKRNQVASYAEKVRGSYESMCGCSSSNHASC